MRIEWVTREEMLDALAYFVGIAWEHREESRETLYTLQTLYMNYLLRWGKWSNS